MKGAVDAFDRVADPGRFGVGLPGKVQDGFLASFRAGHDGPCRAVDGFRGSPRAADVHAERGPTAGSHGFAAHVALLAFSGGTRAFHAASAAPRHHAVEREKEADDGSQRQEGRLPHVHHGRLGHRSFALSAGLRTDCDENGSRESLPIRDHGEPALAIAGMHVCFETGNDVDRVPSWGVVELS